MNKAELIAENFYLFRECFGNIPGGHIHRDGNVTMIDSGIPYPNWNAIFCKKQALQSIGNQINEYVSLYQFPCSWWIGPEMEDCELGKILQNSGFIAAGRTAAMALELENYNLETFSVPEIKILPVSNHFELEEYLRVLRKSFHMPEYTIEALYSLFSQSSQHEEVKVYHYVGFHKDKAVSCASLYLAAGTAGIYHIGVLPGLRGRGIGKMMTIHCLKSAREMGYGMSVLRASHLGEGMYRQLGFKEYGHFRLYRWYPNHFKNYIWKVNYYFRYIREKFTGDAIWFS